LEPDEKTPLVNFSKPKLEPDEKTPLVNIIRRFQPVNHIYTKIITETDLERKIKKFQEKKFLVQPSRFRLHSELVNLKHDLAKVESNYPLLVKSQAKINKRQDEIDLLKAKYGSGYNVFKKIKLKRASANLDTKAEFSKFQKKLTREEFKNLAAFIEANRDLRQVRASFVRTAEDFKKDMYKLEVELKRPPSFNFFDFPAEPKSKEFEILNNNEMVPLNFRHNFTKKEKKKNYS